MFPGTTFRVGPTAVVPATPSAFTIIAGVRALYNQTRTFQATFRHEYYFKARNKSTLRDGVVAFEKPDKMSCRYAQPNGNRVLWTVFRGMRAMFAPHYALCWFLVLYLAIRHSDHPVFRRARQIILQALYWLYEHLPHDAASSSSSSIERQAPVNADDLTSHHRIQGSVPADLRTTGAVSRALQWVLQAFRS
jgi:hypothetical protein